MLITTCPNEIANALETEHRVIDVKRHHWHVVIRIRCSSGGPGTKCPRFIDTLFEDLPFLILAVKHEFVRVLRLVELTLALGKHLDKEAGQDQPLNRVILEILDKLGDLHSEEEREIEEIAIHAANIRQAFFDDRRQMEGVIPPVLLVILSDRAEVAPRRTKSVPQSAATRQDKPTAQRKSPARRAAPRSPRTRPKTKKRSTAKR